MKAWSLHCDSLGHGRTYIRPLGLTELIFYWDGLFNGTADSVQHVTVDVVGQHASKIFAVENLKKVWVRLKFLFPLLGAHLHEESDGLNVNFIVSEDRLAEATSEELELRQIPSDGGAEKLIDELMNGKRHLSDHLLARLFILSRADNAQRYHILFHAAHCIVDGVANFCFMRTLLDELSSSNSQISCDLEERLSLAVASEHLIPRWNQSRAKRRWHRAIGNVIWSLRSKRLYGGHTLPRAYTKLTASTPALSGLMALSFSPQQSSDIIRNCRRLGLTFGNAFPVLGQVALTRVLCRRYIRGEISTEEWEHRKREPMTTGGPLSLRPFLDRQWYDQGGASSVSLCISFFSYQLPFMPLGAASRLAPGDELPAFHDLLSRGRFVHRSNSIRKQAAEFVEHPLFLEIATARLPNRVEKVRETAMAWREAQPRQQDYAPITIPVIDQGREGLVMSHGGSSFGNVDNLLPRTYPRSNTDVETVIHVKKATTALHCRPGELYLGASTVGQQLRLAVFWDKNVYEETTVREWLEEVAEGTRYYLGGSIYNSRL
ncbi:hypothetical protein AX17_003464 [Amanita inopinata Kibby_2008]|nr:hypothetical protein AX17_003464 [Amanita inopinata Kibby_2008]